MNPDPESKRLCSIINELFRQRKLENLHSALPTSDPEDVDINYNNWEAMARVNGKGFARWLVGTCRDRHELLAKLRAKTARQTIHPKTTTQTT